MTDDPLVFGKHGPADAARRVTKSINPCVDRFGRGPADKQCGACAMTIQIGSNFRCGLAWRHRHSRFWPTCAKFEERRQQEVDGKN